MSKWETLYKDCSHISSLIVVVEDQKVMSHCTHVHPCS